MVGAADGTGSSAKILRGEGALDRYLDNLKSPNKVIELNLCVTWSSSCVFPVILVCNLARVLCY